MICFTQSLRDGRSFRTHGVAIAFSIALLSYCREASTAPPPSAPAAADSRQPKITIAIPGLTARRYLAQGAQFEALCTITKPGGFEPMIVTFEVTEAQVDAKGARKGKGKAKSTKIFSAKTVDARKQYGGTYMFLCDLKSPDQPGRYIIKATIAGIDPTVPATGPPPAPAVNGKRAPSGARIEFNAPGLEFEVKQ